MSWTVAHTWVGYGVVGVWAVVCGWGLALRLLRVHDTPVFWGFVGVAQVLLGLQVLIGVVLLALGRLPAGADWFTNIFHVLYGFVFPIAVLVVAHVLSNRRRYNPHLVFSVAGLVLFGLTARAWLTGFGA